MKTNVTAQIQKVTPEMAAEWLADKWGEQRTARTKHVSRLAADMIAGRFKISPDAILRIKNKLANGQHRLMAVVESGKAQSFLVMESNDEELYKVIDSGLRRTASDCLIGIPYAQVLPTIGKWILSYESQAITPLTRGPHGTLNQFRDGIATQAQIVDYCLENREPLENAAAFVRPLYDKTKLLPVAIGAAVYAIAAKQTQHLEKAKSFLAKLYVDGGPNVAGDLRNRLIANKGSKSRLPQGYLFGLTLKALKFYINGTRPSTLRWSHEECFPALDN